MRKRIGDSGEQGDWMKGRAAGGCGGELRKNVTFCSLFFCPLLILPRNKLSDICILYNYDYDSCNLIWCCKLSDIATVIEGAVQQISSRRFELGGLDLTNLLAQELGKSNPLVNLSISDVEKIKEQYACCADDDEAYEKLLLSCPEEQHTLPDGQVYTSKSIHL